MRSVVWTGAPGLADEARPALPNRAMPVVWQSAGWGAVSSAVGRVAGRFPGRCGGLWAVFADRAGRGGRVRRVNGICVLHVASYTTHSQSPYDT